MICFCIMTPNYVLIKFLNMNPVNKTRNFLITTHDQDQTILLILRISLRSYTFLSLPFTFYISESFWWIITACEYEPCSVAIIFKTALTSYDRNWGLFGLFLHLSKSSDGKIFVSSKNGTWITSYIVPTCFFVFGNIFSVYFNCFLIFQSLMLFFHLKNHVVVVLIIFLFLQLHQNQHQHLPLQLLVIHPLVTHLDYFSFLKLTVQF